jgi:hypothetical protein
VRPFRPRWLVASTACAIFITGGLLGCGDKKGPPVQILLAHTHGPDGRCSSGNAPLDEHLSTTEVTRIRVSARAHLVSDPVGSFVCDRVIDLGKDTPNLRFPIGAARTMDLYVEAFGPGTVPGAFKRVATGSLTGIDVNATTLPPIRLYPSEHFRCAASRLGRPRAFHTATRLPNGQVLLIGGLTASPTDKTAEAIQNSLFLTGEAELYDPADGGFHAVTEPPPPIPRAFHHAAVILPGDAMAPSGPCPSTSYEIVLVGGITTMTPDQSVMSPNTGQQGPRLVPFSGTTALPTRGAPTEVLCFDPAGRSLTRTQMGDATPATFQAGAPIGSGLLVAGGEDFGAPGNTPIPQKEIALIDTPGATKVAGDLKTARVGATLSLLPDGSALVWGGGTAPADPFGLLITGLSARAPNASALAAAGTVDTQFHTATVLPGGGVLVTGGFEVVTGGNNIQPPPANRAVRVITVSGVTALSTPVPLAGGYTGDPTCSMDGRYRPAGWESAVDLGRGRILVTGGSPTYVSRGTMTPGCNDCDSGSGILCALNQASLFVIPDGAAQGQLQPTAEPMMIDRFGHTSTLLDDGTVLLTGGISQPESPRMVADAEVYNPRSLTPPYDPAQPADGDADDPLHDADPTRDVLVKAGLQRAPGQQAVSTSNPNVPAFTCTSL